MRKIHITLTVLISLGFALLGVFVFFRSYLRFVEGMRDLCFSVGFFFAESFGIAHDIPLTVLDGSEVYSWASWVPKDLSGFKQNAGEYFRLLVSLDNFRAWGRSVANFFLAGRRTVRHPALYHHFLSHYAGHLPQARPRA